MTSASPILRTLLIYSICLPVAIFLGYIIASPYDPTRDITTYFGVGLVLFFLSIPLLLKWHRVLMIAAWNTGALLYFLPGRPELWLAVIWFSLGISILHYVMNRRQPFISVSSTTRPLIFLAIVVLATAKLTGGMGLGALGSDAQGGKKYILILSAIAGYFALISQRIPPHKASLYVTIFFLGLLTNALVEIVPVIAPGFTFIFWLFPLGKQSAANLFEQYSGGADAVARFQGISLAGSGVFLAMLARYPIRELLNARHLLRLALFLGAGSFSLLGGYRSTLVQLALVFCIVFYLEGLLRSKLLPVLLLVSTLSFALMLPFVNRLPLSIQRALTILPIQVDENARRSAEDTSEWRLEMWRNVIPTVPKYLLLGKGFLMSAAEMNIFANEKPGQEQFAGESLAEAGDFHNGPLSLLIPFGIWGFGGFIWFLMAAWKVFHRNYLYGDPAFQTINRFLFGLFISRVLFFFAIFGSFYVELAFFTGILGLSIAINGGVSRPYLIPQPKRAGPSQSKPTPGNRRPIGPAAFGA